MINAVNRRTFNKIDNNILTRQLTNHGHLTNQLTTDNSRAPEPRNKRGCSLQANYLCTSNLL